MLAKRFFSEALARRRERCTLKRTRHHTWAMKTALTQSPLILEYRSTLRLLLLCERLCFSRAETRTQCTADCLKQLIFADYVALPSSACTGIQSHRAPPMRGAFEALCQLSADFHSHGPSNQSDLLAHGSSSSLTPTQVTHGVKSVGWFSRCERSVVTGRRISAALPYTLVTYGIRSDTFVA